jgi:competence protein ComEA
MKDGLDRYKRTIVSVLGASIALALAAFWFGRPRPGPIMISTPAPTRTPLPPGTPAPLRVYVTGAVHQPDVYLLPPESIVKDALAAAGGATAEADLEHVNLAVQLCDQQQVHIPRRGEDVPLVIVPDGERTTLLPGDLINLNTASVVELDVLPGVGPAIAQRIVDYREANGAFASVEDVMSVKGIGPATYAKFEDMITVR